MGLYGKRLIFESAMSTKSNMTEAEQIIESNFEFLNEDATSTLLKKEINDLSKKDNITKEEVDRIITNIQKISDNDQKADIIVKLILVVIAVISGGVTAIGISAGKGFIVSGATLIISSIAALAKSCDEYSIEKGARVYGRIIKFEAQINNKIKKIQALEEPTTENKNNLKELNKIINLLQTLKRSFKNKVANRESAINEAVLLEFKGNEDKTEAFKIIVEEMSNICEFHYKRIQIVQKTVDQMILSISKATKAKDSKTANNFALEIANAGKNADKEISKITKEYGLHYPISTAVFMKDLNSFTVKYSEVTMVEKKRIADKLKTLRGKVIDLAEKYSAINTNKAFEKKITNLCNEVKNSEYQELNNAMNNVIEWLKYLIEECNGTLSDIDYTINDLKIEKTEKSIIYKAINPKKN